MDTTERKESIRLVSTGIVEFVKAEVEPLELAHHELLENPRHLYDDSGRYVPRVQDLMRQVRTRSSAAGYYTAYVPAELGGGDLGFMAQYEGWRSLFAYAGPGRLLVEQVIAHWAKGPNVLLTDLPADVRQPILPLLLSGQHTMCLGISEPDAGSDIWNMRTTARRKGSAWILNGTKQWITNAPYAQYMIAFAVTDQEQFAQRLGGVTGFLVETSRPGFAVDSVIRMFGEIGGNEGVVSLNDCDVPDRHVIGTVHRGLAYLLERVNNGRLYNVARSVGLSEWAIRRASDYAHNRETFGRPIRDHQAVQFLIADSAIETYAAHVMGLDLGQAMDHGEDTAQKAAAAKVFATESLFRAYDRAIQVFGATGMTNEARLVHGLRAARTIRIADGTSEILRRTVAKHALRGELPF